MTVKSIALGVASSAAVGLIFYGKYRLAKSGTLWWALILGGLVFAISTPAEGQ